MNNINPPVQSLTTLIMSMISAVLLAFFILVAFIGPAEYAIDPTGLGRAFGLTVLAKSDKQGSKSIIACPVGEQLTDWQDIVIVTVPANTGLEYKLYLQQGAEISYQWNTEGTDLYFDFHGEPDGDKSGYFKSYMEATANESAGNLVAPFTGIHGWYWKNDTGKVVNVTLKTKGQYLVKGLI